MSTPALYVLERLAPRLVMIEMLYICCMHDSVYLLVAGAEMLGFRVLLLIPLFELTCRCRRLSACLYRSVIYCVFRIQYRYFLCSEKIVGSLPF